MESGAEQEQEILAGEDLFIVFGYYCDIVIDLLCQRFDKVSNVLLVIGVGSLE